MPISMGGQPFQLAHATMGGSAGVAGAAGPQKLIVAQPTGPGGQPRLIVPAQQVALLTSNGGTTPTTQAVVETKKEGRHGKLKNSI